MRFSRFVLMLTCVAMIAPASVRAQEDVPAPPEIHTDTQDESFLPAMQTETTEPAGEVAPPAMPGPAPEEEPEYRFGIAVLQGLNKVTSRVTTLEAPLGTVERFGNLEIVARACVKSPPEAQPESAALLDISELKTGEEPTRIFLGWMYASSPAVSALEHPVYDITVLDCKDTGEVP